MTAAPLKGRNVFFYFLAFFGFIAAVNAVMVTLAIRTHTGTVTEHAYEKGLAYNDVVRAEVDQEKLGWKGAITLEKSHENLNAYAITFLLKDRNGTALHPTETTAKIFRPTQAGMDFEVALKNNEASITFPDKGLWEVRVFATLGKVHYQQVQRVVVP